MKHGFFLSVALAALLSACVHSPSVASQDSPNDVGRAPVNVSTMDSQRDIVLAVAFLTYRLAIVSKVQTEGSSATKV